MEKMPDTVCTLDALHAVGKTFETVVQNEMDFMVCIKGNAADLRNTIDKHLNRRSRYTMKAETVGKEHGRIEERSIEMHSILPWQTGWPHVHTVCRVTRIRKEVRRGEIVKDSEVTVHYAASFSPYKYTTDRILKLVRQHWSVENELHHIKDRSMDEDRNRATVSKTGRIMCCMRSIASQILRRAKESTSLLQTRFTLKKELVLGLLSCSSLPEWERKFKPYKLA
jgi:predicted transposase YbfD/YdcC